MTWYYLAHGVDTALGVDGALDCAGRCCDEWLDMCDRLRNSMIQAIFQKLVGRVVCMVVVIGCAGGLCVLMVTWILSEIDDFLFRKLSTSLTSPLSTTTDDAAAWQGAVEASGNMMQRTLHCRIRFMVDLASLLQGISRDEMRASVSLETRMVLGRSTWIRHSGSGRWLWIGIDRQVDLLDRAMAIDYDGTRVSLMATKTRILKFRNSDQENSNLRCFGRYLYYGTAAQILMKKGFRLLYPDSECRRRPQQKIWQPSTY